MWKTLIENDPVKKSKTDKKIVDFLFKTDESTLLEITISDCANKIGVSAGTLTKFFNKYGFSGWKNFKNILVSSLSSQKREMQYDFNAGQLKKFLIDSSSKNIFVFGHGMTLNITKIIAESFRRIGLVAFNYDVHEEITDFNSRKSIYMFVSLSGRSKKIIEKQKEASKSNGDVVVVTVFKQIFNRDVKHNVFLRGEKKESKIQNYLYGAQKILKFIESLIAVLEREKLLNRTKIKY